MSDIKHDEQVEFRARPVKCVYNSDSFKVYAMDINASKYPSIKRNRFGNVSISGDISELALGVEYEVIAIEEKTKYGIGYKVLNIRRDIPTSSDAVKEFLNEILTENQATTLYDAYPNIIDIVKNDECDIVDLDKLHGIGEKTFEKIKQKIIENFKLVDLVGEFKGAVSLSMIRKIYDKYPDVNALRDKLKEKPYDTLTRLSGVGFIKADNIVLRLQKETIVDFGYDVETSIDRCMACVVYFLQENEKEGNTHMNLADLRSKCIQLVPACANHFADAVSSSDIYYNKERMEVGLTETYLREKYIAETIASNIQVNDIWHYDVEKYRDIGEFSLSDEQMMAISNLCRCGISILNGNAGAGKSYTTKAIINMLKDNNKKFLLAAPTGKAAKVLSEYTREDASTIHRALGYNPRKGWAYNKYNRLPYDVVIVDEFSMCDVQLFAHLIDAIDFYRTRLMLVGDNAQLPSVGCGNLLHDFMVGGVIPTTTLTKIFRYGEGGLMRVATDIRCCKPYLNKPMSKKATQFGVNKDYMFIDTNSESMPKMAVALYKKLLEAGNDAKDIQILTAKNIGDCGTIILNSMIQKAVNENYGSTHCMKVGDIEYYKGDLVMQIENNYSAVMCDKDGRALQDGYTGEAQTAFVANGETAVVISACRDHAVIDFDGIMVLYNKDMMSTVRLGYACTIHKSQGSGIDNVILCTPKSDTFMLNSNLLYVGVTRTRKKCYHFGAVTTVNNAVRKKENLARHTFTQELLKNAKIF